MRQPIKAGRQVVGISREEEKPTYGRDYKWSGMHYPPGVSDSKIPYPFD